MAGQGLCFGPLIALGIAGARRDDAGAVSGLVTVAHQMGLSFGLALPVAVAALAVGDGTPAQDFAFACHAALTAGAALLFLAFMVARTLIATLIPRAGRAGRCPAPGPFMRRANRSLRFRGIVAGGGDPSWRTIVKTEPAARRRAGQTDRN